MDMGVGRFTTREIRQKGFDPGRLKTWRDLYRTIIIDGSGVCVST